MTSPETIERAMNAIVDRIDSDRDWIPSLRDTVEAALAALVPGDMVGPPDAVPCVVVDEPRLREIANVAWQMATRYRQVPSEELLNVIVMRAMAPLKATP